MKKKILTIFLTFILFTSTILYLSPFQIYADYYFENVGAFSEGSGNVNSVNVQSLTDSYFTDVYNYTYQSGWNPLTSSHSSTSFSYQLPAPFINQQSYVISSSNRYSFDAGENSISLIGFGFNLDIFDIVDSYNLSSGSYFCFAIPMYLRQPITALSLSFGQLQTGSSYYQTSYFVDDKFLCYNPNNISGMTTSTIINDLLWSTPSSNFYSAVVYANIPYSEFQSLKNIFSGNDMSIVMSLSLSSQSSRLIYLYEPIIYICSQDEIDVLLDISGSVKHIDEILSSGVYQAPPDGTINYDYVHQLESSFNSLKSDPDLWNPINSALGSYDFINGLKFVGLCISQFYNGIPLIQAIYGVVLLVMIIMGLRGLSYSVTNGIARQNRSSSNEATFQRHREQINSDREDNLKKWGKG